MILKTRCGECGAHMTIRTFNSVKRIEIMQAERDCDSPHGHRRATDGELMSFKMAEKN